jgi:hypothetical protein
MSLFRNSFDLVKRVKSYPFGMLNEKIEVVREAITAIEAGRTQYMNAEILMNTFEELRPLFNEMNNSYDEMVVLETYSASGLDLYEFREGWKDLVSGKGEMIYGLGKLISSLEYMGFDDEYEVNGALSYLREEEERLN